MSRINEHPTYKHSYERRNRGCGDCAVRRDSPRDLRREGCADGACFWDSFDPFAHDMLALWGRVREAAGKNEGGGVVWRVNYEAANAYMRAGGPLVDGYEGHEILDGVIVVNAVKNGATRSDE